MPLIPRNASRTSWLAKAWLFTFLLIAATVGVAWNLNGAVSPPLQPPPTNQPQIRQIAKPISEVQLGERVAGVNPIREQAEEVEPDPETWRKISLRMKQESGNDLWIELLRPQDWGDLLGAEPNATIPIDMPEMGAVGDAMVLDIVPCPPISSGLGTVVTGKFRHEPDEDTEILHLHIDRQTKPTTVTASHTYWSVDRRDFVEAGNLKPGEILDTLSGLKRVRSTQAVAFRGSVYNLETTEHVYRVGFSGSLVHNSCVLLPTFPKSLVDEVVLSARRPVGETLEGARGLSKKIGHANSKGIPSAFDGVKPTQVNAERVIRETMSNPARTVFGNKTVDVYNSFGQGVRFDKATKQFIGFLEGVLASR